MSWEIRLFRLLEALQWLRREHPLMEGNVDQLFASDSVRASTGGLQIVYPALHNLNTPKPGYLGH